MNTSFASTFNSDEKAALREFCHNCDQILECPFIKDLPKQDHSFKFSKRKDGSWDHYQPIYDRDDFRSYMTLFRKFLMKSESAGIYRILNILSKNVSDEDRREIKKIKKRLQGLERYGITFNLGADDVPNTYSPRKALDVVFNSDIFHSDKSGRQTLDKLRDFGPFFEMALVKFATDFTWQAIAVSEVIKLRNYFY